MHRILFCMLLIVSACTSKEAPVATAGGDNRLQWRPDAASPFEAGTQLRPWTIRDEGMGYILDNMQSMAGINSVYLVAVMHKEHRPFQAPEFPHNPARDSFDAEDSRVSFFPDLQRYGVIKPLLSDYDWIRDTDWMQMLVDSCRTRGMRVGVEVSHYPVPTELVWAHPDWQLKKIDGMPWNTSRPCPNHPDVREYLIALFGDLAAHYDVDYIQTCQYLFNNRDIDAGGACFCRHCIAAAAATGFDLEAAIPILMKDKNARPERDQWIAFRCNTTTALYRQISETIQKERPGCDFRFNDAMTWIGGSGTKLDDAFNWGMDLQAVAPYLGSVVNQDHQEQLGIVNETFERRRQWLTINRDRIGPELHYLSGIAPRMGATPALVRAGIKAAVQHPARITGLALKHYDGASFSLLRAFKQGMIEAGVQGLTPTIGKEVEDMTLDHYAPFTEELVEEWGVQTTGTGTAVYNFDSPPGLYHVRITYFDEENGQSRVTLFIAGEKMAVFTLNEDTDCWRRRTFNNIRVNTGDEIKLVGQADGEEQVKLDFIEFIPAGRL